MATGLQANKEQFVYTYLTTFMHLSQEEVLGSFGCQSSLRRIPQEMVHHTWWVKFE